MNVDNNSRFRFRIWHKGKKRWLENAVGTHCFSQWLIDVFTGEVFDAVGGLGGEDDFRSLDKAEWYFQGSKIIKESPYVIQQFAGFRDSAGIEIYEGDILHFKYQDWERGDEWNESNGEVYFDNHLCCFCFDRHYGFTKLDTCISWESCFEVVGNIFEHSESLK